MQVNGSYISRKLLNLFAQKELSGHVFSRFENALNIEINEGFLFNLLPENIPPNPRSLILPEYDWNEIQALRLTPGLPVCVREEHIEIPDRGSSIAFDQSKSWDPTPWLPDPPNPEDEIYRNLEIVASGSRRDPLKGIPEEANKAARVFQDKFRKRLLQAKNDLTLSIAGGNLSESLRISSQLIGLGQGLTPSGDDVLSGVMASGVYCSLAYRSLSYFVTEFNDRLVSAALNRTTIFSRVFLIDSSRGEVVRPLGKLLQEILCRKDHGLLLSLTRQVMAIGATSGGDMLEGVLAGLKCFIKLKDGLNQRDDFR